MIAVVMMTMRKKIGDAEELIIEELVAGPAMILIEKIPHHSPVINAVKSSVIGLDHDLTKVDIGQITQIITEAVRVKCQIRVSQLKGVIIIDQSHLDTTTWEIKEVIIEETNINQRKTGMIKDLEETQAIVLSCQA